MPIPPAEGEDDRNIVMVTKAGIVKRMPLSALSNIRRAGLRAVNLREGDRLVSVALTSGHDDILVATHEGQAARFSEEEAREMGRTATGVIGMRLSEDDYVVGAVRVQQSSGILTVTERGYGKCTDEGQFPSKHRGSSGVICHVLTEKTGKLAGILSLSEEGDLLLITSDGQVIRSDAREVRVCGRASQGVILLRAAEDTRVIDVDFIPAAGDASGEDPVEDAPEDAAADTPEAPVPEGEQA